MQNTAGTAFSQGGKKLWYLTCCGTHMGCEGDTQNVAGCESLELRQSILCAKDQAYIGFSVLAA